MSIYSLIVTSHNIPKLYIDCLKYSFTKKVTIRNFNTMTKKVHKNDAYIAVKVAEDAPIAKNRFTNFFRRKSSAVDRHNNLKNSELKRLFSLAKPEKWKLTGAIGFLLVSSAVTMTIPFSLGKVLDIIYTSSKDANEAKQKLNKVCGVLLCIFVLGAICNYGRIYFMSTAGYRMTNALRRKVFGSILRQEQGWFDRRPTGELINRLSADTQIVGTALSQNISDGLRSFVMVCAGTGMMFYMSSELALLPNDMENYMQYHLMGTVSQVRMKPGCMPTKFECQPGRKTRTAETTERAYICKKQKIMLIDECEKTLAESSVAPKRFELEEVASTSSVEHNLDEVQQELPRAKDKSVQVCMVKTFRSKGNQTEVKLVN